MPNKFTPFANESDTVQINGLTIENRLDRVSLFGSIDFTNDKAGLEKVLQVKRIVDAVAVQLEESSKKGDLPEAVKVKQTVPVDNPFGKEKR